MTVSLRLVSVSVNAQVIVNAHHRPFCVESSGLEVGCLGCLSAAPKVQVSIPPV